VRVLGNGRPFILSLLDPKSETEPSATQLRIWEDRINLAGTPIRVKDLRLATDDDRKNLLDGEHRKKLYACVVEVLNGTVPDENPVDGLRDLLINQNTPIRVAHRRAMMVRQKTIFKTTCCSISPSLFIMWIEASGGCYIKEFVHSDCGRTHPSVASMLGKEARLLSLDYYGSSKQSFEDVKLSMDF